LSELRVAVAGCAFAITPAEELSREERTALTRLSSEITSDRVFTIRLNDSLSMGGPKDGEPAAITADGDHVYVTHTRFAAVIDPFAHEASLHREDRSNTFAIEVVLRTALGCRLPMESGLLLHSAGIVIDGGAYLFYGVSGSGKSTLAGFMRNVLSDELVAVQHRFARATGFWGTLDAIDAPAGTYPLRALIELGRGDGVSLESISARDARRKLLMVAVVPPHPQLWMHTLEVIESLARLPAFCLEWTPSAENAKRVVAELLGF